MNGMSFATARRRAGLGVARYAALLAACCIMIARAPSAQATDPPVFAATLHGQAVDAQSSAPLDANVLLYQIQATAAAQGTDPTTQTETDADGNYSFRALVPGAYYIVVQAVGYINGHENVTLASADNRTINFKLQPLASPIGEIRGHVTDSQTSAPIAHAYVWIGPPVVLDPPAPGFSAITPLPIASTYTNDHGEYVFQNVPVGSYFVHCDQVHYLPAVQDAQVIAGMIEIVNFQLDPRPILPPAAIAGEVVDQVTSAALAHALVVIDGVYTLVPIYTDDQGIFKFGGLPPGPRGLTASKDGYLPQHRLAYLASGTTTTLLMALQPVPTPPPPGSVRGIITDATTSAPLAGVRVYYAPIDPTVTNATLPTLDITSWPYVVTNPNGVYEIGHLRPAYYALRTAIDGYYPAYGRAEVASNQQSEADFALLPKLPQETGIIAGHVRDQNGGAIANALVFFFRVEADDTTPLMLESPDPNLPHVQTDAQGYYEIDNLKPGHYLLVVRADGFGPARALPAVQSGQTTTVDFALVPITTVPPGNIEGIVRDALTSAPLSGALVYFYPLPPELTADSITSHPEIYQRLPHVTTDDQGHYQIQSLRPNYYRLIVRKDGYAAVTALLFVPSGQTVHQDFRLLPYIVPPPGAIQGYVTDSLTSHAIGGAYVFYLPITSTVAGLPGWAATLLGPSTGSAPPPLDSDVPYVRTNDQGHYEFAAKPGYYLLVVWAAGRSAKYHGEPVTSGHTTEADFALDPIVSTGSISGHVSDSGTGAAIGGAYVFFGPAPEASPDPDYMNAPTSSVPFVRTGNDGNYVIGMLQPGRYVLVVLADGYLPARDHGVVTSGHSTIVNFTLHAITPPNPGSIAGLVSNDLTSAPISGATVSYYSLISATPSDPASGSATGPVNSASPVLHSVTTGADGKYVIEGLAPGYYHLLVHKDGFGDSDRTVLVVTNQRTAANFRLKPIVVNPPGYIFGVVTDQLTSLPLAGARVYYRMDPPDPVAVDDRTAPAAAQDITTGSLDDVHYVETGPDGHYAISPLLPGLYRLEVVLRGYDTQGRTVTVTSAHSTRADFALAPSTVNIGALHGVVVDAMTSKPLAHAHVWVVPDGDVSILTLSPLIILGDTYTNDHGEYLIQGLPAVQVGVYAAHDGYRGQRKSTKIPAGGIALLNFALQPIPIILQGDLVGHVYNAQTSQPLSEALVALTPDALTSNDLSRPPNVVLTALTDATGAYALHHLPAGSYHAHVSKPHFIGADALIVIPPNQTVTHDFRLAPVMRPPLGRITGLVVDSSTSLPLAGVWVGLDIIVPQSDGHPIVRGAVTNTSGTYTLVEVPAGTHRVFAVKAGFLPAVQDVVVVGDQSVEADFALHHHPAGGFVEGAVQDALTSAPLANAIVFSRLADTPNAASSANSVYTRTDANGHYRLGPLAPGAHIVVAFHPAHWPDAQLVNVVSGGVSQLDFNLLPRPALLASFNVLVVDSLTGKPIPGALYRALLVPFVDPDSDWNPWLGTTGAGGTGLLNQVPGTGAPLIVSAPGYVGKVTTLTPSPTPDGSTTLADATPTIVVTLDAFSSQNAARGWTLYK